MAALIDAASVADFDKILANCGPELVVVHFWAAWAPQCEQMNDVLKELSSDPAYVNAKFVKVEAEAVPEISMKYSIEAVPSCILIRNNTVVDRVNGANVPELNDKVQLHGGPNAAPPPAAPAAAPKEDLNSRLKKLIESAPVMLFMKGSPDEPRCGFSRTIVGILKDQGVPYKSFDILSDDEVRQGLKTYSNWPTYPQLYASGELIGGLDIIKELVASDEFKDALPKQESLDDRLKAIINKERVMVFMKGSPDAPRCGFSKTLVGIMSEAGVPYGHFDILTDEEVRQGLKKYSNWPTYPQLYVKGELIGGLDIIKEMQESDDLLPTLKDGE